MAYNSFVSSTSASSLGTHTLQVSGLDANTAYRRFFIRLNGSITRGAEAAVTEPETVSELVSRVTYAPTGTKIDVNCSGYRLDVVSRARYSTRKNRALEAATETLDHWIELPLTPVLAKDRGIRPAGQYLENSVIKVTLAAVGANITAFDGAVELWAQGDDATVGMDPANGGVVIQDVEDFNGSNLTMRDGDLSLLLLERRDDFTDVNARAGGMFVYQQATALSLDVADYEHQQFQATQTERLNAGDPLLVSVPASGDAKNYTRLFDIRNDKSVQGVVNFTFSGRTASNAYPYVYVSFRQ